MTALQRYVNFLMNFDYKINKNNILKGKTPE